MIAQQIENLITQLQALKPTLVNDTSTNQAKFNKILTDSINETQLNQEKEVDVNLEQEVDLNRTQILI